MSRLARRAGWVADARLGLRGLRRRPAFALATLLTLALGVGGTAAVVGAIRGVLLAPLPFPDADRLVFAWERSTGASAGATSEVSPANFLDWRERTRSFTGLAAMHPSGLDWQSPEGPLALPTWLVSEGFFDLLAIRPLHGRTFADDDHHAGRVVVLGHRLWQRRFGGDPNVVGRSLTLDQEPYEVIGVLPPELDLHADAVWAPRVWEGWERRARTATFFTVLGRLRPDVTLTGAAADLDRVSAELAREHPRTNADRGARLVPYREQVLGPSRRPLLLLLAAVAIVLLVATANVTSLQLSRALERADELAVRLALGANEARLRRQLVAENLALGLAGGALGAGVGALGLAALRQVAPPDLPRLDRLQADPILFAVALLLALAAMVTAAALAARLATRRDPARGLRTGGAATGSPAVERTRTVLVTSQLALAVVLLVGVGLLARSLLAVLAEDRGFRSERVAVLVTYSWSYYSTPAERAQFVRQAIERLEAVPGVEAAGMTTAIPLAEPIEGERGEIRLAGADPTEAHEVAVAVVTDGYFRALEVPLRSGRLLGPEDQAATAPVAVINRALAHQLLPGVEPLGQRIRVAFRDHPASRELEIVGVVGDLRRQALHAAAQPTVYLPHGQLPLGANGFLLATSGPPLQVLDSARHALASVNGAIPVAEATSLEHLVRDSLRDRHFLLRLIGAFGAIVLVLAACGVFGLISVGIVERRREIAVRMALGADLRRVIVLVLRRGARLAGLGILLGIAAALATSRVLASLLHRVGPFDPISLAAAAGVLLLVTLIACVIPALRAAGTDPANALRAD